MTVTTGGGAERPVLTLVRNGADGALELSFQAETDRPYSVEQRSTLTPPEWSLLEAVPPGAARLIRVPLTPGEVERYFRVVRP